VTVAVILTREFLVAGMREFLGPKNIQLPVTKLAKWKTAVQMLALGFLLVAPAMPQTLAAGQLLLALAAALTAITGWSYLREGYKHMGS
jgi:phosphatidylglycerophosphate synthase